ncbi:hypothetical protein FE257_002372 [Aspergillus nanangensis]|uniref:DUF7165 domain-containing protein n=1 Tax=Aspergillus nanangensis TaxID=2582783 RepID=A0AAD4CCN7_ASPNN|nr:hypothetical protein FE257_002372 [Aspergillus nanangensis]
MVRHELKTWRRPLHATILDDGSLLAVVSSSHRVNIYSLCEEEARHIQELELNDVPQALALSPTGGVLALAYRDRIEVYAIGEATLATERRAVRCAGVNSMSFSPDGVMLIGSCEDGGNGLVTISVPFFTEPDADSSPRDAQVRMWTTQILFPDIIQDYSHACLLPLHTEGDGTWILGFDREIGAFRAIGASNIHSGTAYFTSPLSSAGSEEPPPIMSPAVDCAGELVVLGFQHAGLWIYGIPDRLDIAPIATANGGPVDPHEFSRASVRDNVSRLQGSITRPKVIIRGHKVSDMPGVTAARWVGDSNHTWDHRRLVAVAPGGINPPTIGEEDVPVDGGRVLLLDFTRSSDNGDVTELSIEIGEAQPKMLNETNASMDTEVELERRRTRLHRRNDPSRPRAVARESYPAASVVSPTQPLPRRRINSILSNSSNDLGDDDALLGLDAPYDNTQPRSRDTLRRAATAAAVSRSRYNPRHRDESQRVYDSRPVPPIFQVPHESDADNWVPPPPPYSREATAPLPDYLRRSLLPSRTEPVQPVTTAPSWIRRAQTTRLDNTTEETSSRTPLQRLNTISGSRLASRMRRNSRETEPPERRQTLFLRRRLSSSSRTQGSDTPDSSQIAQLQPGLAAHSVARLPPIADTSSQGTPTFPNPREAVQPAPVPVAQPGPTIVEPIENEMLNLQHAVPPMIGNIISAPSNHPYSLSSPNLQFSEPYHNPVSLPQDSWLRPGYHRAADRRSQSHDIRQTTATIPALNRRASTDPTLSTSSQPSNDLWRRRIEDWNDNTIHERNKRRNKCIVM